MTTTLVMPYPHLSKGRFMSLEAYSDEALFNQIGVRVAFTTRAGGVSTGPYASLNFGSHVEDNPEAVNQNRAILLKAFQVENYQLLVPHQVHQDTIVTVDCPKQFEAVQKQADQGADAVMVDTEGIAALLCFADCVPVIAVAPTGLFCVIHAGWRGVENEITAQAVLKMAQRLVDQTSVSLDEAINSINVYIGPYIHGECFETGPDIHRLFVDKFGSECSFDDTHLNLGKALSVQLGRIGVNSRRIADVDKCTVCNNSIFFSYRAQDGIAGRHGAFAYKK